MLVTTGYNFEGYTITQYLDVISSSVVLGTGFFSSFSASIADISGTRSGSYERKLEDSKNEALMSLIDKANHIGGNAIIGIDIDYTTFSSDIMGVVINGTAVKIEKYQPIINKTNLYSIPVFSYDVSLPFNICSINFEKEVFADITLSNLEIQSYIENGILTAIVVDIELYDIFDDINLITDIIFCVDNKSNNLHYSTSDTEIPLNNIRLDLIQKSYIIIKKIKFNNSNKIIEIDSSQLIKNTHINENELSVIKNKFGDDSVIDFESNETYWTCYCGATNKKDDVKCYRCGRDIVNLAFKTNTDKTINQSEIYNIIMSKENGVAIYKYIKRVNELNKLGLEELVYELEMLASRESWDGNMKDAAFNMVKRWI